MRTDIRAVRTKEPRHQMSVSFESPVYERVKLMAQEWDISMGAIVNILVSERLGLRIEGTKPAMEWLHTAKVGEEFHRLKLESQEATWTISDAEPSP